MSDQPTVLIVDDEPQMRMVLSFSLETYGFTCLAAASAEEAMIILRDENVDVVLADVMLPGHSGLELCERIKNEFGMPVILLTAKGEPRDRLEGLELGAADYIAKPFHPKEVVLRLNKVLRVSPQNPLQPIVVGDLVLQSATMTASLAGESLRLSIIEFRLLVELAHHLNEPVATDTLIKDVWSAEPSVGDRDLIKATVHRLRTKLKESPLDPRYVVTVRGIGYMMPGNAGSY